VYETAPVVASVVIATAVNVSLLAEKPIVEVIPPVAKRFDHVFVATMFPATSTGVTVIVAFSNGAYVALSNAIFTVLAVAEDDLTVISFEVAVASATVDASMTFSFAVPAAIAVTGQRIPSVAFQAAHCTGVVAEPATRASAAAEATMYAVPRQSVPFASTALTDTAPVFAPILSVGCATAAVMVFAAFA